MDKTTFKPIARKSNIVVQEFGDETLIYDLVKNKAFSLNETSSLVWQLCDGTKTVREIVEQLSRKLNNPVNEDLVWFALEQLKKDGLIEGNANFPSHFEGLTRREVIRRVGLASMVALPVIASLVAPMAIHSQTGCGIANNNANQNLTGCACQSNNDCNNNCCGFGLICANTASVANGGSCRVNCECISNNCVDPPGPTTGTCQP